MSTGTRGGGGGGRRGGMGRQRAPNENFILLPFLRQELFSRDRYSVHSAYTL